MATAVQPGRIALRQPVSRVQARARVAAPLARSNRRAAVAVRAEAATASQTASQQTFLEELREYSMKLHTKAQAPKEGKAPEPKQQKPFQPTREGFLRFMVESKVVYDAFEQILQQAPMPYYKQLVGTGLERGEALAKDIQYMQQRWGLAAPVAALDGPGHKYASFLREVAVTNPPGFLCHYYNHYFAHTAGGRMIGKSVSNAVLDGWSGAFYDWAGDVKELQEPVRATINGVAAEWSREEKDACLAETPATFAWGGRLVGLIAEAPRHPGAGYQFPSGGPSLA